MSTAILDTILLVWVVLGAVGASLAHLLLPRSYRGWPARIVVLITGPLGLAIVLYELHDRGVHR